MALHQIVSVEKQRLHARKHDTVTGVVTRNTGSALETRWSLAAVLKAMNSAERFFTQAKNGRQARVQRYACAACHAEHIRTHVSDSAIDDLELHRVS